MCGASLPAPRGRGTGTHAYPDDERLYLPAPSHQCPDPERLTDLRPEMLIYLQGRGVPESEIHRFKHDTQFPNRIACLCTDLSGRLVGWQLRGLNPIERTRYRSVGHNLTFGLDRIVQGKSVYICEGPFDALYFTRGVAVCGPRPTEDQLKSILAARPSELVFAVDAFGDLLHEHGLKLLKSIDRWIPTRLWRPPDGIKDAGVLLEQGQRQED